MNSSSGFQCASNDLCGLNNVFCHTELYNLLQCITLVSCVDQKFHFIQEDIVTKLFEFLEAPHATTSDLLADKDQVGYVDKICFMCPVFNFMLSDFYMLMHYVYQSSKGTKRKRSSKKSTSPSGSAPSKSSSKVLAGPQYHSFLLKIHQTTHNHHKETIIWVNISRLGLVSVYLHGLALTDILLFFFLYIILCVPLLVPETLCIL